MDASEQKEIMLDCGISPARILAWLTDELNLIQSVGNVYVFEHEAQNCNIAVVPLEKSATDRFSLERTQLVIKGNVSAVDAFMRLFTLRFLSAGG